jgi:membrane protease YdiL (CAAX protease family)
MLRVPFDAAHLQHVQRNRDGGCLRLGSGAIQRSGTYTVEAIWPHTPPPAAVLDVPIALRVLARSPLTTRDRSCVLVLGLAVLGLIAAALGATSHRPSGTPHTSSAAASARVYMTLIAMALLYGLSQLPSPGSSFTLAKGVLLLALQTGLAFWFTRQFAQGHVAQALGLWAPTRMGVGLSSAVVAWPLLVGTARLALRWVPSTGEAPIQSFISWPSGMLAAALLGVLLPAAEELFFRGYLYAALLQFGRPAAAIGSVALFGLMHAEQGWGNWGGLAAVFAAGAVLCGVRVLTDSTLIAALTHVAYNLTLSLASIAAASATP